MERPHIVELQYLFVDLLSLAVLHCDRDRSPGLRQRIHRPVVFAQDPLEIDLLPWPVNRPVSIDVRIVILAVHLSIDVEIPGVDAVTPVIEHRTEPGSGQVIVAHQDIHSLPGVDLLVGALIDAVLVRLALSQNPAIFVIDLHSQVRDDLSRLQIGDPHQGRLLRLLEDDIVRGDDHHLLRRAS